MQCMLSLATHAHVVDRTGGLPMAVNLSVEVHPSAAGQAKVKPQQGNAPRRTHVVPRVSN